MERHRQLMTDTVTSSLKSYSVLFSTYFQYSYAGRKFKYTRLINTFLTKWQWVCVADVNALRGYSVMKLY
jgi:hypothetical protein